MSTKSNNNAAAAGPRATVLGAGTLGQDMRFLQRARMELAWFSGYARLRQRKTGGAGVVLRFERVRPRQAGRFQPLRAKMKSRRNFSTARSAP